MDSSAFFSLRLLGGFALERNTTPCELAYEKGRALLAYLAAEPGRAYSRTFLATMLWPELAHKAALTNLRQVLHNLRQILETAEASDSPLQINRESVCLNPGLGLKIDTMSFSAHTPACLPDSFPTHCTACLAQMETLAKSYRGEFMAGFSLPECSDFDEWLQVRREALHLHALSRLARLAECYERQNTYAKALPFALQFLDLEPWSEEGLQRVIRLFAFNGQRDAALAQYEASSRVLKRELGVLPSEATRNLVRRIHQDELVSAPGSAASRAPSFQLLLGKAERRQVTVLNCELSCSDSLDPEEILTLLCAPHAHCSEIISRFSGFLVQIHGESLLAYFGYPQAREIAARLALQAALALTNERFPGIELRVGVHTGMLISSGDLKIPDAIGATSGLAIGLCQLAEYGEVVISDATRCLVAGYFESVCLGCLTLPTAKRSMEVFRVDRESGARYRLEAERKLTPLIGRKKEIANLLDAWRDTLSGHRRMLLLTGDAGVGKSRLVFALKEAMRENACVVRELRCFPEHSQSPFHPLKILLELIMAFSAADSIEARFEKLVTYVGTHFAKTDRDVVPLIAKLLMLPLRPPYREPDTSPEQQREKALAILLDRFIALATGQPVLLVMEDLHWADPSSLEFLNRLIMSESGVPFLALFTARSEFKSLWPESRVDTLRVNALNDTETSELIAAVAPGLEPVAIRRLVERADGIPLFAEELARNSAIFDQSFIPGTLNDLLAARLDSMGIAKTVAQAAATVGREFSIDLLRRIARLDDATLTQSLSQLQDAGILQNGGAADYRFRHALIKDAAYQSQTRTEREAMHRRVASALIASGNEPRPELLAQHWSAGGETRQAIACWSEAGKLASQNSANQEAAMHFKSALAFIASLPAGKERERLEYVIQLELGTAMCALQGYASPEAANAYGRAMTMRTESENEASSFRASWGYWGGSSSRGGYSHAQELAQKLLLQAHLSLDPVHVQQAHFAVGDTSYWQGQFVTSLEYLTQVKARYLPAHHEQHIAEFGEDAGITSSAYTSWVLWFLGFPEQARTISAQTVALARQIGHPFSLAYALTFAAILHARLRLPAETLILAQETQTLADKHGFLLWQIGAMLSRGWALALQNHHSGIKLIEQCVKSTRTAMGGVTLTVLEPLVEANTVLGHFDAALEISEEAFTTGRTLGDGHIEAELFRLKGVSLLSRAGFEEAETCFCQALAVSRRQQAKTLELRAAMSMARLWQRQGKGKDARYLLEDIYAWFSEGFSTPDLLDARKLLDILT